MVYGAKLQLISQYASQVPFVDQWGGEAMALYRPWLKGELTLGALFSAHNEHRIVFTRLLDLAILALNGQWDSRLLMVVQAALPALFCTIIVRAATRWLSAAQSWLFAVITVLFYASNVSYGNTLWAFQSQFYFFLVLSVLHIGLTFYTKPRGWGWWLGHIVGLANLFSIAAGVLTSIAVAITALWSVIIQRRREKGDTVVIGWNAIVASIGLMISRNDTSNDQVRHIFRPDSLGEAGRMVGNFFAWPFSASSDSQMWIVVFAPAAVWLGFRLFRGTASATDRVLMALTLVVTMQNVALGLFRGVPWSRYLDGLSLGIVLNLGCALALRVPKPWHLLQWALVVAWCVSVVHALSVQQEDFRQRALPPLTKDHFADLTNVRAIVRGESVPEGSTVGGVSVGTVKEVVADPYIMPILPSTIRSPIELQIARDSEFGKRLISASEWPESPLPGFQAVTEMGISGSSYRSQAVVSGFPYLYILVRDDGALMDRLLSLETADGEVLKPYSVSSLPGGIWSAAVFPIPRGSFYVVAISYGKKPLEFSEPVEVGRWTVAAERLLERQAVVWLGGCVIVALSAAMTIISSYNRDCV